jgi:hypothetical protein
MIMRIMNTESTISFGDNVRVLATPLTQGLGLAGMVGKVYGETMPSVTNVEVIGEIQEDYAINIFFKDRNESSWFAPELLEFIDHAPGTEIRVEGVPKKWVRTASGEWVESNTEDSPDDSKPWWKFW